MTGFINNQTRRQVFRSLMGSSLILPAIVSNLLANPTLEADPLFPRRPHFALKASGGKVSR